MNKLKRTSLYIFLFVVGGFLFIRYWSGIEQFIKKLWGALIPVLSGFIIAYIINIPMSKFETWYFPEKDYKSAVRKTKRPICLAMAYLSVLGVVALILFLVIPKLFECFKLWVSEIPTTIERFLSNEKIAKLIPESVSPIDFREAVNNMAGTLFSKAGEMSGTLFSALNTFFSFTVTLLLSTVFSVYILLKKEKITDQVKTMVKTYVSPSRAERIMNIASVLDESFKGFIKGQCIEAVILGLLCSIGMFIFRFPYPFLIGTLIGFTAIIPIAGAFIGAGIGTVIIMAQSPVKAVFFIIFIIILQQLEENLVYPKVVGKRIGLPAFYVLTAITVGGRMFGILGILISVPLFSAVYKLVRKDVSGKSRE